MSADHLVDYLRDKLNTCTCTGFMVGRPAIGYYRIQHWTRGCPQHPDDPYAESNRQQIGLIDEANARVARQRRWWRRWE